MSELFDARFRELLTLLVSRVRRLRGRREDELRARRLVSAPTGSFAGHRPYSSGEDTRYVDWNVYARTGDLYLKILEEDERRTLTLLLDCSPSMLAGDRFVGARQLAAILGCIGLAGLDSLRLVTGPEHTVTLSGASGQPRLLRILESLESSSVDPLELARIPLERGWHGSLVWLSDFAVPDQYEHALKVVRENGRRLTGVLPSVPEDKTPLAAGWLRLSDPETGVVEAIRIDTDLRRAMNRELRLLARLQDAVFSSAGCRLERFTIPETGDRRPSSWFPGPWIYRL